MFNGATVGACAAKITEREKKRDGERERTFLRLKRNLKKYIS